MYSKELIDKVKKCYPDSPEIHELADSGSVWLGRYLDDSSPTSMPLETILEATSLEELQREAKLMEERVDVYNMWCKEDPRT
jgi:hypothetical protein